MVLFVQRSTSFPESCNSTGSHMTATNLQHDGFTTPIPFNDENRMMMKSQAAIPVNPSGARKPGHPNGPKRQPLQAISNIATKGAVVKNLTVRTIKMRQPVRSSRIASPPPPPCSTILSNWQSMQVQDYSLDYKNDIYYFMLTIQKMYSPNPYFMSTQADVNSKMRTILVDWLAEVVEDFDLSIETLHLAVNYVDRYLSRKPITRNFLQLLGIAALLVASKFEDLHPCKIRELVEVCNKCYSAEQIGVMERKIIHVLDFGLHATTLYALMRIDLEPWISHDLECIYLSRFVAEVILTSYELLCHNYSELALAAVFLVKSLLGDEQDPLLKSVDFEIVHKVKQLLLSVDHLAAIPGIVSKYSQAKYLFVATRFA